jgi:hypothetical protein
MTIQISAEKKAEFIEQLRGLYPVGSFVNIIEMKRNDGSSDFRVLYSRLTDQMLDYTFSIAKVTGYSFIHKTGTCRVSGHGTHRGYEIVYALSRVLHGEDYALKGNFL